MALVVDRVGAKTMDIAGAKTVSAVVVGKVDVAIAKPGVCSLVIAETVAAVVARAAEFCTVTKGGVGVVVLAVTVAIVEEAYMEDVGSITFAETIAVGVVGALLVNIIASEAAGFVEGEQALIVDDAGSTTVG